MKYRRKNKKDIEFVNAVASLNEDQFRVIASHLDNKSIDYICGFLNFLLSNPDEKLFAGQKELLARLIKAHKSQLDGIAGHNSCGVKHRKKRKTFSGGALPIIPILAASVPLIVDLLTKK